MTESLALKPVEIRAPHYMRSVISLWQRYAPGGWVPVRELRSLMLTFGDTEVIERAIEEAGARGDLTLESIDRAAREICKPGRRAAKRRADHVRRIIQ